MPTLAASGVALQWPGVAPVAIAWLVWPSASRTAHLRSGVVGTSNPAEILRRAIEASGLSARRFATEILLRDERTIRRWLAGDRPIPKAVLAFLTEERT